MNWVQEDNFYITRNGLSEIKPEWFKDGLVDQGQTVSYMPYNEAGSSRWATVAFRWYVKGEMKGVSDVLLTR